MDADIQKLLEQKNRRLEAMHEASRALLAIMGHTKNEQELIQKGIDALVTLVQARYGAVSLLDACGIQTQFIYTGIGIEDAKRIGHFPQGKGLLAVVVEENQVLRIDDVQDDDRSIGFPPNHPPMKTMIAAPIAVNHSVYGRVYLCDKPDGSVFSDDDEQFVMTFANTLAVVILNLQANRYHREAEEELHLAARVIENTHEGVMVLDKQGRISSVNPAFSRLTGYAKQDVLGKKIAYFFSESPQNDENNKALWDALASQGVWKGEFINVRKTGESYHQWTVVNAIRSHQGEVNQYVCMLTDITERKKEELYLKHMAHYDSLTRLPNRILLEDRLESALSISRRYEHTLAVMFLDLDLFKKVNDTLGHIAGDRLLFSVAERLQHCVREVDTVARMGGDEFTVVLTDIGDQKNAELIAKKILESIAMPFNIKGHEVKISTSIGIALFPDHADSYEGLVKLSDRAMYESKKAGNGYTLYFDGLGDEPYCI